MPKPSDLIIFRSLREVKNEAESMKTGSGTYISSDRFSKQKEKKKEVNKEVVDTKKEDDEKSEEKDEVEEETQEDSVA